ncbi:peptidoglycan/LPS O-acetylase OafA/YrhL [Rhizobium sp. SG_E_25_P2]|uniref:acyltransferase family protein n=1 Tax=Rhizobium sp. SG_E_25_P2 TaxID=2879942 RepID=UPI0024757EAB|nr:acyltransferase [Rhizobium sp. SG_E_25_P2]MDH6268829.1 peptidoglycan/LPS O-acetylase OafA/YrhL [Rhizobium sp. SG_E_25_P2]
MADPRQQLGFLDGLRGYASLWVVIGHAMFLTGYKVGLFAQPDLAVEVFIIISGFLMTYHYQLRESREPWDKVATWTIFWIRRFFRIAPLYYVCLALALWFGPELWQDRLDAAAIFPGGVEEQMRYADRYLDQSLTNILLHVTFIFGATWTHNFQTPLPDWSIGLEMQYYAFLPLLMLLVLKAGRLPTMLLVVAVMWAFGAWLQANGFVKGAFSMLPMKIHLFAAGMLIAMSLKAEGQAKWLYLISACAVVFVPLGGGRDSLHRAIKIGLVLVFFAFLYRDKLPQIAQMALGWLDWLLSNVVSRFFGDVSYGVYLIHLLVMLPVCAWLARMQPDLTPEPRFAAALGLTLAITYGLAYLAFRLIETPGIALGRRLAGGVAKPAPPLA